MSACKERALSSRSRVLAIKELRWIRGESLPTHWLGMTRARAGLKGGVKVAEASRTEVLSQFFRWNKIVFECRKGGVQLPGA